MKALAKKREDRLQTMGELVVALDEVTQQIKMRATMPLPPLPPGADPLLTPRRRCAGTDAQLGRRDRPRRAMKETRPLHEPAFAQGPMSLPPPTFDEIEEAPVRRWPYALLVLVAARWWRRGAVDDARRITSSSRHATTGERGAAMPR